MTKRTPHGDVRHAGATRPTGEATADIETTSEIYLDVETGYYIFVGVRGRAHIFTVEGLHHTSFRTSKRNREARAEKGKWERVRRDDLLDGLK